MIEEYDKIDLVTRSQTGGLQLVVMDAGLTEDSDERYDHLINKLRSYVAYADSGEFRESYPDEPIDNISILVMCRIPPTEKMLNTKVVTQGEGKGETFPIYYRHFPGSDSEEKTPIELRREVRTETKPGASSNIPVHIAFGILFLFLAATRYLIYFGPLSKMHSINQAQAIGASLGYLVVWSLGYWLCATTPKKTLVTGFGAVAVILSTLFGSFIGYLFLVLIYFIRKAQYRAS